MKRSTVTVIIVVAVLAVLFWRIGRIYFESSGTAGVSLVIGETAAYRGSHGNRVGVVLENPVTRVRGMQFEICDDDNYLSCSGCEVADRISGFTCTSHEKPNGCYELIVFSFNRVIEKGYGSLLSFNCDVSEQAPGGECRQLSVGRLEIADENKQPLEAAVEKGRMCFEDCTASADCGAGLWCYEHHSCANGVCQGSERCPDDGLYCNGREYCDEDAKQCSCSPEPCAYCYEDGCRCDEERDLCEQIGGQQGDRI
jgi:hypothetical protein